MKKILFIIFFELIIKCVRKKYSIMFIDMLHRLKNKYVHTCKINDKFPYLDMSCDDQFKRNCPVKHTLLISCCCYSFTVVYLYSSYDSQTTKNEMNE